MKKKLLASCLALALTCAMSTAAFAANPIITDGGSDSANVKASYKAGGASQTVYSVDIVWGSLAYTYTGASQGTWNPETHEYNGASQGGWSCTASADYITVKNHSNASVAATFDFTADNAYNTITGSFDGVTNNTATLATAEGTSVDAAPSATAKLALSGALDKATPEGTTIGNVTVTITAAN